MRRILVVEDEIIVAESIKTGLEKLGYLVFEIVLSGEEAINKAAELQPDLVLMDIKLKGEIDGVDAAEHIYAHLNIPVVYLTAYADDDTLERAKITESFGYVLKPFDSRELHGTIEMALYKHKMEQKLRESEERFRRLAELSPDTIVVHVDKKIVFVNAAGVKLLGASAPQEILGKEVTEFVHPDYREIVRQRMEKVLKEEQVENFIEQKLIRLDGRTIDVEVGSTYLTYQNKPAVQVVARDITERKQLEEERTKTAKLESIGILAGGIAHDFNNILTAVQGNISLAKMFMTPEDKAFAVLIEAEKASLRARDLTQKLLTFSKGGAPIKKTASIANLLKDAASMALRGFNIKCSFSIPEDLWPAEVDELQITRVLNNVIINAGQAMPEGGEIKVQAENVIVGPEKDFAIKQGRYVKITVEDQGCGIPEENLPKIFDPYFSTKDKGSGLGLTTAYSIVNKHSGCIEVKSKIGVGTTVQVYLPASTKDFIKKGDVEQETPVHKGRILLMDDEELIRNVAGNMLEYLGHSVEFAGNGAEALNLYRKAKEAGRPFDVVILDLTVPGGMGGQEAMQKLLEMDPQVKAIVSSGYSTHPVLSDFSKYGFSAVVFKPYKTEELGQVVNELLRNNKD
ncbi:MAG TPA: response regulator [archaeon]|nr:response regulator [archaeon]